MSILIGFCGSHQFFMADILEILKEIKSTTVILILVMKLSDMISNIRYLN